MNKRELKFRTWDMDHKRFIYFDLNNPDEVLFGRHGYLENELPEPEWNQYTGLQDKNGKEVFEGDIVAKNPLYKFQVVWKSDWGKYCLQAFLRRNKRLVLMSVQQAPKMEILGNIYENPELSKSI